MTTAANRKYLVDAGVISGAVGTVAAAPVAGAVVVTGLAVGVV